MITVSRNFQINASNWAHWKSRRDCKCGSLAIVRESIFCLRSHIDSRRRNSKPMNPMNLSYGIFGLGG